MDPYRARVRIFIGVVLCALAILVLRLGQLQLIKSETYAGESRNNAVRKQRVQPARGGIYDRNGVLMVDNEPSYTILLTPRYFDPARVPLLADLLNVPDSTVAQKLEEARRWSPFRASRAFREVPFHIFSRVQEHSYLLPGVSVDVEEKRRYHTEARAAHALGYIREITRSELERSRDADYRQGDLVGKAGLEKYYEPYLRGRLGYQFKLVNVHGQQVEAYRNGQEDQAPLSGYDLHLGIDSRVQALAESLFVNKRGAAVALDPSNGAIIALVSEPDYDPEIFSKSVDDSTWAYLTTSEDKPMFNRATMMGQPPGSTWKPFMALMALEEGIINEHTTIHCPGGYRLGNRLFRDHGGHAHGTITVKTAIEQSCNTFFFTVMMRGDLATWSTWARRFGFGEQIPMDVREQVPGLIPDSSYYNRVYPRGWTDGYTINLGIGQGDMYVTPMELARYTAALANGGTLHPPHLVQKLVNTETGETTYPDLPDPEHIPVHREHFEIVREGMHRVMKQGTGRWVQIPGIPSAGKTGTAENPHGEDHSIFILFAPYDDPQIAIAVMVENAGFGATAAAPIASLMAEQYLTGQIADLPQRRLWIRRLMNEIDSKTQ